MDNNAIVANSRSQKSLFLISKLKSMVIIIVCVHLATRIELFLLYLVEQVHLAFWWRLLTKKKIQIIYSIGTKIPREN